MLTRNTPRLCFIGFGEAGQAMAAGLREEGIGQIAAWDILFPATEGEPLRQAGDRIGVRLASSAADAVRGTDVIVSAVTAASSLDAARSVAPHLKNNPIYLDVNSVSPGRKQATEELLGDRARYIDVAILSPIYPARHRSPMLLAGPHAQAAAPILQALAMRTAFAGPQTGAAAAIKMVRSVMIKGIEALTYECFVAAQRAGLVQQVADSLRNNYPTLDWDKIVAYNLERMASHGERRAAEMEEVAETLRELGIDPQMVTATVKRQREMGALGKTPELRGKLKAGAAEILDAVSAATRPKRT
jgi:3-hydroxyisobutyrate dehydrogenase-like beta-hydroxyacid dehydrogenase